MRSNHRISAGVILLAALGITGCSTVPESPETVGENYPGTCLPPQFAWPTDFLESLPSESSAVGGPIVGLRLEYIDEQWAWRFRSTDSQEDMFGERVDDPSYGRESLVDVRTSEIIATHQVELTEAEQSAGSSAYAAAQASGETWPSPLIIEMARVMDDGNPVWQLTMCDTETNEHSVITVE